MTAPEISELGVVLALVEEGGFAGAAKRLGVTQPAVSCQIAKLEQNFGFPLFHRRPDGTEITTQGKEILPLIMEVEKEARNLLRRATYWKRAIEGGVSILADGSTCSQSMRAAAMAGSHPDSEIWQDFDSTTDWANRLMAYDTDIVITGSFLLAGDIPGIKTTVIRRERGMTCAWNPDYFDLYEDGFDMPAAISSPVILTSDSMAIGFRKFLTDWCESTYGRKMEDVTEAATEANALELCSQGMGVLLMPGNADARLGLCSKGLGVAFPFGHLLPESFTFGIRHREDERSPSVLAAVRRLGIISQVSRI